MEFSNFVVTNSSPAATGVRNSVNKMKRTRAIEMSFESRMIALLVRDDAAHQVEENERTHRASIMDNIAARWTSVRS
jgi:hypothetical protein